METPDSNEDDRREIYREVPPTGQEPQLTIVTDEEQAVPDAITDINARGVKVEFEKDGAPQLIAGKSLKVDVAAPGLQGNAEIDARTVFAATRGERLVSAIAFAHLPSAISDAGGAFFSVFNRRSKRRPMADSDKSGISASVMTELASDQGHPVKIANYSKTGIGIVAGGAVADLLNSIDEFRLQVQSKRTGETRLFTAHVVHRAMRGEDNYFGCLLRPVQQGDI